MSDKSQMPYGKQSSYDAFKGRGDNESRDLMKQFGLNVNAPDSLVSPVNSRPSHDTSIFERKPWEYINDDGSHMSRRGGMTTKGQSLDINLDESGDDEEIHTSPTALEAGPNDERDDEKALQLTDYYSTGAASTTKSGLNPAHDNDVQAQNEECDEKALELKEDQSDYSAASYGRHFTKGYWAGSYDENAGLATTENCAFMATVSGPEIGDHWNGPAQWMNPNHPLFEPDRDEPKQNGSVAENGKKPKAVVFCADIKQQKPKVAQPPKYETDIGVYHSKLKLIIKKAESYEVKCQVLRLLHSFTKNLANSDGSTAKEGHRAINCKSRTIQNYILCEHSPERMEYMELLGFHYVVIGTRLKLECNVVDANQKALLERVVAVIKREMSYVNALRHGTGVTAYRSLLSLSTKSAKSYEEKMAVLEMLKARTLFLSTFDGKYINKWKLELSCKSNTVKKHILPFQERVDFLHLLGFRFNTAGTKLQCDVLSEKQKTLFGWFVRDKRGIFETEADFLKVEQMTMCMAEDSDDADDSADVKKRKKKSAMSRKSRKRNDQNKSAESSGKSRGWLFGRKK